MVFPQSLLLITRVILVMGVTACIYGLFNKRWRNLTSGEILRGRSMKGTGAPASMRTHTLNLAFWTAAAILSLEVSSWHDVSSLQKLLVFIVLKLTRHG
ncbi:hypothetical protein HDF16_005206 [Granulicella aggregans]|uniref:MAPEG family protein n=1 Tax=Granulicella aggregans TaxID=474949 RepID=A0A7W8E7P0_9BACT|nr:hypothetical protein [Granulicella aggregans]